MIFSASLSVNARKALPGKVAQKSIQYIISILPISPTSDASGNGSDMEVLLLGPMDFRGAAATSLPKALESKHPDVCVIYLYSNDKEKALCNVNGVYTKQVRKVTPDVVKDAVSEFYGQQLKAVKQEYNSMAGRVLEGDQNPAPPRAEPIVRKPKQEEQEEVDVRRADVPEPPPELPEEPPVVEPVPQPAERHLPPSPQELVNSVRSFEDWDVLKKQLERDSVISDALLRSSEFNGVRQMMEVYSVKMNDVMADSSMTSEQKLMAIKEFGHNRQALAAAANSKMVDDWLKLWNTVCSVAERIVKERLDVIQSAVAATQVNKEAFLEQRVTGAVDAEKKLNDYAIELINIQSQLTNLWAFAYEESTQNIGARLNEKLPSDSEYINALLGESIEEFRTDNAESLINKIFTGLKEKRISLSQVQDQISALYLVCFKMLIEFGKVTAYQKNVMDLLRANHVENIVIRDTMLKDCFRLFVGTENTGLSATVAIYAGMVARRENTVVLDLTGHSHYDRYGQSPISLDEFMAQRVQQPLLYVSTNERMDPEQLSLMVNELKSRMTYYRNIIVVLDASQTEEIDQLGREALTIAYVTNCSAQSLAATSEAYRASTSIPNVGRLLCAIDAPVDASVLIKTLALDISTTRLVLIPYMRDVKAMAITHTDPTDYGDILQIYEAAFRV